VATDSYAAYIPPMLVEGVVLAGDGFSGIEGNNSFTFLSSDQ